MKKYVSIKWLEKWCEGKQVWRNNYVNVKDLLSAAKKKASGAKK